MEIHLPSHRHRLAEDGYVLLSAIFLMALLTIALSVAMPVIIRQIQLDRERETMERGKQYRRAVQLYFRKFHAYPPSVSALEMTNNIRFLRKQYTDPMTGKDDWRPILFGQNKTPTAMGFFGQPLNGAGPIGASTLAGIGPSGGNTGTTGLATGGSVSPFNSGLGPSAGDAGAISNTASTSSNQNPSTGSGLGSSDQTFGGAGIIGFTPGSTKQSITVYKKKDRYSEWEFTYDPMGDATFVQGNGVIVAPPGSSLVGSGSGPDGTGPAMSPNAGAPGANNATQ
jgi:type II secretory pathway pseudopilin PulG